jgi:hypothetical protein
VVGRDSTNVSGDTPMSEQFPRHCYTIIDLADKRTCAMEEGATHEKI